MLLAVVLLSGGFTHANWLHVPDLDGEHYPCACAYRIK